MQSTPSNLRKAAVLFRNLDAETSAMLLAQLSPQEATMLRQAIRALGEIDPDETSDVVAEFRRMRPVATEMGAHGVELQLTSPHESATPTWSKTASPQCARRFEFLDHAPVETLVPYLSREHVQTIAVVLSHLLPERAAAVLARLPERIQADVLERLSGLGETDPESLVVLEHELAAWLEKRSGARRAAAVANDAVAAILAAAEPAARNAIVANLKTHKSQLADRLGIVDRRPITKQSPRREKQILPVEPKGNRATSRQLDLLKSQIRAQRANSESTAAASSLSITFEQLIHFDDASLAAALANVDGNVLMLALAGSSPDLIDRISRLMPNRMGRAFRKQLRQLGPTRLSDVEAAQQTVCRIAAQQLSKRRSKAV
jgi:flagellar motor switch protein FliG